MRVNSPASSYYITLFARDPNSGLQQTFQITQHKYAWPFIHPVNVEGLGLDDYYEIIDKPMDFSTIKNQMEAKDGTGYKHIMQIYADMRLVFENAMNYNEETTAVTGVFWDLDGCPIPVGLSPASIYDNIKLALNNMGYTGALSVSAYSLKSLNKEDFESASINLVQPGSGRAKRESMFGDVCLWGLKHRNEPTNLMVISKNTWLLENDYLSAFPLLKDKENNILLTLADQDPSKLLKCVATSVWLWTSLSTGGYPLGTPTSKFSTAKTGVIWDLEYCPIPCGLTPASVSQNIKLALKNMGYTGQVSITAYSLTDQNKEDFESATIKLVQPGSGSAKRESMFVDLYGWGLKHRHEPTNLMLISKNFSEDLFYVRAPLNLKEKENNILLAQPENPGGARRGIPTSFWLWSSLSNGGSPLDSQSVSSSQIVAPSPSSSPPCSGTSVRVAKKKKMKRRHKKPAIVMPAIS